MYFQLNLFQKLFIPKLLNQKHGKCHIFLLELLYSLFALTFLPINYFPHIGKRMILCLTNLILLFPFQNLIVLNKKVNFQYPSVIFFNILFLLNKVHFLAETDFPCSPSFNKRILLFDTVLEMFWRFFVLQVFSAGSTIKILHLVLYTKIFFGIVAPVWHKFELLNFTYESLLICASVLFSEKISHSKNTPYFQGFTLSNSKAMLKFLNILPEGLFIIDSNRKISFANNSIKNMFDGKSDFSLKELEQNLPKFVINEASIQPNSFHNVPHLFMRSKTQISTTLSFEDRNTTLEKTSFQKKLKNISCLGDLFTFCVEEPETKTALEQHMLIFQAKYYCPQTNEIGSMEIKTHLFRENEEKYLIILLKDTTERERKIVSLEKEKILIQDDLIASFSHELRTPLNSSLNFLEQGIDSPGVSEEAKEKYFRPALISGLLLYYSVGDILDYSLMIINELHFQIKPKSILQTVNDCLKLLRTKMTQKNLELKLSIKGTLPEILFTDHIRVSQVLINLLNNALQFTMQGKIEVTISKSSLSSVTILVKDTGIGMSQNTQTRLSNQLTQDKLIKKIHQNSVGIGLGLFVSNKLAQKLNNEDKTGLEFRSKLGIGSEFSFKVSDQRLNQKLKSSSSIDSKLDFLGIEELTRQDISLGRMIREYDTKFLKNSFRVNNKIKNDNVFKVLIVDDEIFNITILENFCKSFGFITESAYNGEEALKKIERNSNEGTPINIIFMDINMPVMNGFDAASAVQKMIKKKEIENLYIIGVTAYVTKDVIEKAYQCGISEVVNKPLSKNILLDILVKYGLM